MEERRKYPYFPRSSLRSIQYMNAGAAALVIPAIFMV